MSRYDAETLAAGVTAGDRASLARSITLFESRRADHRLVAEDLLRRLAPSTGGAIRLGVSGPPGVGKSTFIERLGCDLLAMGKRPAVLAVDPSSGKAGGSILGDKTRMANLSADPRAYIRPSPSGGKLGGVARATREAISAVEAAGHDVVIVETVGAGQNEFAVADMVDLFLLLALPGAGDELQGVKKGVMEIADVIAVNKADGKNAGLVRIAVAELSAALRVVGAGVGPAADGVPVMAVSALTGDGVDALWRAIEDKITAWRDGGRLNAKRADQRARWLWAAIEDQLKDAFMTHPAVAADRERVETAVRSGEASAAEGARRLLAAFQDDSA